MPKSICKVGPNDSIYIWEGFEFTNVALSVSEIEGETLDLRRDNPIKIKPKIIVASTPIGKNPFYEAYKKMLGLGLKALMENGVVKIYHFKIKLN